MEAEFVVFANTVQEAFWLRKFLYHLGIITSTNESVTINCNNLATIGNTKDPKYHSTTNT